MHLCYEHASLYFFRLTMGVDIKIPICLLECLGFLAESRRQTIRRVWIPVPSHGNREVRTRVLSFLSEVAILMP
jgi:hypothetical protein